MKTKCVFKIILSISVLGILFSGFLTMKEFGLFGSQIAFSCSASAGDCTSLLGLPVCVYGLIMYCLVFIFSILGLKSLTKKN